MGAPVDTLVVGLGNPILSDDGVGWRVATAVQARLREAPFEGRRVDVIRTSLGGLALAELLVGYRCAIIVDAIMRQNGVPGEVYALRLDTLQGTLNSASAHDTNLRTALVALRRFGAEDLPTDETICVVAIQAADVWTFAEQCTPAVAASVPRATELVLDLLSAEEVFGGDFPECEAGFRAREGS